MIWHPIATLEDGKVAILYQPQGEFQDEGMVIASIRRERYGLMVDPTMIGGYEYECALINPTHWTECPEKPT